jgi:hypothetical protein
MAYRMIVSTSLFVLQLPNLVSAGQSPRSCKESAGSPGWPSASAWAALNESISGRLLHPPPPGAVCHSDQPTYNNATCPVVQAEWATAVFHQQILSVTTGITSTMTPVCHFHWSLVPEKATRCMLSMQLLRTM